MSERVESLLEQQLQEMRQTNALLAQLIESNAALIEALAQSDDAELPMLITWMVQGCEQGPAQYP
ncbi:TPA: hypothetical protein OUI22_000414 [Pseudomonas aeruginosa]|nr:hypothetical protein [Pseudomonas aeruginosa]